MVHLVTADGRYHGETQSIELAREILQGKVSKARALSDEEWTKVRNNPEKRAELCGALGTEL